MIRAERSSVAAVTAVAGPVRSLSPPRAILLGGLTVGDLVVLPLSALHGTGLPSALAVLLNGVLIHIVGVGTPSALFARAAQRVQAA